MDAAALEELESYRDEFSAAYSEVEHILRDTLGYEVTGRPAKSTIAIVEKLKRQKTRLTQIQDIAGCRILVGSVVDQDSLINAAKVMLGNTAVDDKRDAPTNGYRAVHLIVSRMGKLIEVQIRTRAQHLWAEVSEKLADTYGQDIKYGAGDPWALAFLNELSIRIRKVESLQAQRIQLGKSRPVDPKMLKLMKKQAKSVETTLRQELYRINGLFNTLKGRAIEQ